MVKVLVSDNSGFMREMIKKILQKEGLNNIVEAVDGIDTVKQFERETPDLVVIDAAINRLDGLEATRRMKEINPRAKVILISIIGKDLSKESAEAGAAKFVQFPFEKNKLGEAVRGAV